MIGRLIKSVITSVAVVVILFLSGCASVRSDFKAIGERNCFSEDFAGDLYAWNLAGPEMYRQVSGREKSYLQFQSSGGASIENSLVSDFRMEFEVRLESPIEYDITTAMINFRNYFNKRYCLILEPEYSTLAVARVKHNKLEALRKVKSSHKIRKWYKYEIVAVGEHIRIFKNDRLIIDIEDPEATIDRGNIWFESHAQYSFTSVKVCPVKDFVKVEEQEEKEGEEAIPVPKEKYTVAVGGFENLGVPSYEVSLLSDLYSQSLLNTGVFRVVERKELNKILSEQELQLSDITEDKTVQIGRIMNAQFFCTGSVGRMGETYILNLKLLKVETGETTVSVKKELSETADIIEGLESLSERIARKVMGGG